ncbi:MAG: enoyl-CoA hydratase-related protein, partial [Chloroflexota bacterium]|nr:enoyl-CoA hydratase-related protein [Chloroflexota bacterium]
MPGAMADYAFVRSTVDGPVGIVTLDRPGQLNALSGAVMEEVVAALEAHEADAAIRAIVITGGPAVFAAGADLKEMAEA